MKILVTGATGFIGASYVRHLVNTRPDVSVYFSGRDLATGTELASFSGAHFFRGDLADVPYVQLICKDMDVVVHCAGHTGVWGPYETYYHANVLATENLLQAALTSGVQRFVNLSSPSIYFDFNDHLNITEDFLPPRFADNYGRTKYQAERRVARAHSEQMKTLSLRPRMVIGPGDYAIFPRLIALHDDGLLRQVGEGRNIISLTSLDNMMLALDCAVFGPDEVTGDIYNVADPQPVNFWETVNSLMSSMGLPNVNRKVSYNMAFMAASVSEGVHRIIRSPHEPAMMRQKVAILGRSFTLNIEKAKRKLGYNPEFQMQESIDHFVHWWLSPNRRKRQSNGR